MHPTTLRALQWSAIILIILGVGVAYFLTRTKAAVTINTSQNTQQTSSLVGQWSFNGQDIHWVSSTAGTATDTSGGGHTGSLTNMSRVTSITEGKIGQAIDFGGTNQYISIATVYNGVKSVSFWIKSDNPTRKIIDLNGTANIEVIALTITANGFTSPTIYVDGAVSSLIDTDWHFVTITTETGINASAVDIGRVSSGYFDGKLDDVRFYSSALSSLQIASLYSSGGPVPAVVISSFICGSSTVADVESNIYNTILIGTQCWMASNMMTTKYPDGTAITRGPTGATWNGADNAYYAYPPNVANTAEESLANITSGKLGFVYQWSAAMKGSVTPGAQGICPAGWHVPTHNEYTTLERAVCTSGSCVTDFPIDTSTTGWRGTNEGSKLSTETSGGNNSSGFTAHLAGYRNT
ncbi:MAG: FISUMP domain-containing protein, partial [bacterium]|nr:FISUMP domain-containing protein [bacterium]